MTLGAPGAEQLIETMESTTKRRFMLHYNFPPYSTGEVKRLGVTGRREIGHGALAGKAVQSLIPSQEEFPYTIRIVSEILSSNGFILNGDGLRFFNGFDGCRRPD